MSHPSLPDDHPAAGLTDDPVGVAAVDFLHIVFNRRQVQAAFDTYVGDLYIQHNPMVPDGRDAAIEFLGELVDASPEASYNPKRIATNGEIAMVHAHVTGLAVPEWERGIVAVDILRIIDGKVVEHWDVVQAVPGETANDNGMF